MTYFVMSLDLQGNSISQHYPPEQHEAFLEFMHALEHGKAFPEGYRIPCDFKLGAKNQKFSDADLLSSAPAFSPRAQEVINTVAGQEVQFIPFDYGALDSQEEPFTVPQGYAWMNILNRVSCLEFVYGDERPRKPKWSPTEKRNIPQEPAPLLTQILFHPDKVRGLHIFRPEEFMVIMVVSQTLKDRLEALNPIGLMFEPLEKELISIRRVRNNRKGFWPAEC